MTPYFLALDHLEKKIVVTIRGTLSMKDLVTDLNADAEFIPVNPLQTNPPWLAHKVWEHKCDKLVVALLVITFL